MSYVHIVVTPDTYQKKINVLVAQGYKVLCEEVVPVKEKFSFILFWASKKIASSVIHVTLVKESDVANAEEVEEIKEN